jgi:electron-transferring-flavoprotein dehydrogenase
MSPEAKAEEIASVERMTMEADIVCAGFGPAVGGFLTALTKEWKANPEDPAFASKAVPGMPLQVLCYERADDISAGVSGIVTRAQGLRTSFPDLNVADIPMAAEVGNERLLYLLDPIGASRRSRTLRVVDAALRGLGTLARVENEAFDLPWTPAFLHKHGGLVLSMGQFNQWVGSQLMAGGMVQIWPGTPISAPIFDGNRVSGVRLMDQGVDRYGKPEEGYCPGMDVRTPLTVVGDGPVGAVGQAIDERFGLPAGHSQREWALGMKMVIELPEETQLKPGTVWHTFGYPEPEIFGFLYVHPERLVSVGIFVPSWLGDPSPAYRYLQHYIQHPAIWKHLKGGVLRSWGAKSMQESGRRGEPFLTGDGYARIGEGSGSTNMLSGSGVDEAWTTGVQLAESVIELLRNGKPFTKQNLAGTYEVRRHASYVESGAREAENARNGFHSGIVRGMIGMTLAGLTGGKLSLKARIPSVQDQIQSASSEDYAGLTPAVVAQLDAVANAGGRPLHDALLTARGWPEIRFDGQLLVTQQDALLKGGKVQAMAGYADHVIFRDLNICAICGEKTCIPMCSGQAITQGDEGIPVFEREKCIHCGACLWNCAHAHSTDRSNIEFRAGAGGLHSAEN